MEKSEGSSMKMKTNLCIPRFRNSSNRNNKSATPMSLLDRFREAVFRLIMLSALSKGTHHQKRRPSDHHQVPRSYYNRADPHHSEAVADCIEFIKKKASPDGNRGSSASYDLDHHSMDVNEVLIPMPIM